MYSEFKGFWFQDLWNDGNDEQISNFVHDPFIMNLGGNKKLTMSFKDNADFIPVFQSRFDPFNFTIEDSMEQGSKLCVRYLCHANYQGNWLNIAGDNQKVVMTGIMWFEFSDQGKMRECWLEDSDFDLYQQLTGSLE